MISTIKLVGGGKRMRMVKTDVEIINLFKKYCFNVDVSLIKHAYKGLFYLTSKTSKLYVYVNLVFNLLKGEFFSKRCVC